MCGAMFFSPTSLVAVPRASAAASRTDGSNLTRNYYLQFNIFFIAIQVGEPMESGK